MNKCFNQTEFKLGPNRLIYNGEKPAPAPAPAPTSTDKQTLDDAVQKAAEKTRKAAIDRARASARGETATETGSTKPTLPPLPDKTKGLKLQGEVKKNENGTVEQTFKFGDMGIPGRIIMPDKPEAGKKTTIVFNYVDDPSKSAESEKKLLEQLKKSKTDLGNTVVVTLRTPEGTTKVDAQEVDTMTALMADLERFQADINKNPKTKDINLARAETVLHIASRGNRDKVKHLLQKYHASSADADQRVKSIGGIIDNDPDKLLGDLEEVVRRTQNPEEEQTPASDSAATAPVIPAGGGSGSTGGGGGGAGGSETGSSSTESETTAPAEAETTGETTAETTPEATPETTELAAEGIDKLLILGDSNMELTQKRIQSHYGFEHVETTAVRSKHLSQLHGELKARGSGLDKLNTEKCRGTILVNGGGNDIAAGKTAEEIFGHMKAMMEIAKEHNLKIFFCAIAPFGDTTYESLQNKFEEKNAVRIEVNKRLYELVTGNPNSLGVIPLDKKYSEGGLADDEDPNKLHKDTRAGDGLHLSGKGTDRMAELIRQNLGELKQGNTETPNEPVPVTPIEPAPVTPAVGPATPPAEGQEWVFEDHQKVGALASQYQNLWKSQGRPVGYHEEVVYNGQTYLLTVMAHKLQGATGRRIPKNMFDEAEAQNFPLELVGTHWFYAVEVKKRKT